LLKNKKNCSVPDLIVAATAKYLREFFDVPKETLHNVTMDRKLREGISLVSELPAAYDPTSPGHAAHKVFI
jgi:hypothetical protein